VNNRLCLGIGKLSPVPLLIGSLICRQSEHGDVHTCRKRKPRHRSATQTGTAGRPIAFVTERSSASVLDVAYHMGRALMTMDVFLLKALKLAV